MRPGLPAGRPGRIPSREALAEAAWFARCVGEGAETPLSDGDIRLLAASLVVTDYPGATALFSEGEVPDGVLVVREGRIECVRRLGRRRVTVHILHPGDVHGDVEVLLSVPSICSGRTLDAARLLRLPTADFRRLLVARPHLAARWLTSLAGRKARADRRILQTTEPDLRIQVAALLLEEEHGGVISLSHQSLADLLGVRRPSVTRALRDLRGRGMISTSYRRVDILDRGGLETVAERFGLSGDNLSGQRRCPG